MELSPILLIDKPLGITSFDVIRELRRLTGVRKFGHAGTLDPLATGLMILGVNEGTKQLTELVKLDKEYIAEIRIGERRSTGDLEGDVLESKPVEEIFSREKISSTATSLIGTHTLPVSAYSAIKKDGIPMYKRARKAALDGEVVKEVPRREMTVLKSEVLETKQINIESVPMQMVKIRFHVESGVYIRSLAEEFGKRLGYPATLQALRRTKVGKYKVEDAQQLADFIK